MYRLDSHWKGEPFVIQIFYKSLNFDFCWNA